MHPLLNCLLVIPILLATSALAQPSNPVDEAGCKSEEASLIQEMDIAQARGRMLQRRQLAEQLAAVQLRCGTHPPVQSREAGIARLQKEIADLRKELDRAETDLRKLRQGL
ncbi:DUF1090 family protein [Variovorax boronicumulans]|uniref:DUF1090 family protein n=1 Tax=Variovorax boronicumulans TaxID=436515 RepID=UPI001C56BFA1